MDEIGIEDARRRLGDLVDLARYRGTATCITRQGKPAAVVVSADWYDAVEKDIHLLRADYIVGHKDGDPLNNDPGNLEIIPNPSAEPAFPEPVTTKEV